MKYWISYLFGLNFCVCVCFGLFGFLIFECLSYFLFLKYKYYDVCFSSYFYDYLLWYCAVVLLTIAIIIIIIIITIAITV
jgi:hypothetical protein